MQLSKNDLIKYLMQVKNLETSLLFQKEVLKQERNAIKCIPVPQEIDIGDKPTFSEKKLPNKPEEIQPRKSKFVSSVILTAIGSALLVLGLMLLIFVNEVGLFPLSIGVFLLILGIPKLKKSELQSEIDKSTEEINKHRIQQWESKVEKINKSNKKHKEEYEQKLKEYYKKKTDAKQEYNNTCTAFTIKQDLTNHEIACLEENYNATKDTLEKLYSYDVLYPKYRNLVAVCSICEYLESGRVDTLEGRDGAYNLFELELRQNIIINELSRITSRLEAIKSNQFLLYEQIVYANNKADNFLSETRELRNTLQSIEDSQQLIAYNTSIIKNNSEALNTIALLHLADGYTKRSLV